MLNTKELKKITSDTGLSARYLFSYVGLETNAEYNPKDIIALIKTFRTKNKRNIHGSTDSCLAEIVKALADIKDEEIKIIKPTTHGESMVTITAEELSKKLQIPSGSIYWYMRKTKPNNFCGTKKYTLQTIKNTFIEILRGNTKYRKELQGFIDNPDFYIPTIPQQSKLPSEPKQIETLIELQKETNNILKQLLEIWRK